MVNHRHLTILGSTGSVGASTLDVVARHPDRFSVFALTAQRQVETLFEQCRVFKPRYAVMLDPQAADTLAGRLRHAGMQITVLAGIEALEQVASNPRVDTVMAAIVGAAGKLFLPGVSKKIWIAFYVALGWLVVAAAGPMLEGVPLAGLILLAVGGLLYTVGIPFYVWERLPFRRAIWHGFVMAAAGVHYAAVLTGVVFA